MTTRDRILGNEVQQPVAQPAVKQDAGGSAVADGVRRVAVPEGGLEVKPRTVSVEQASKPDVLKPKEQGASTAVAGEPRRLSYVQMYEMMNHGNRPETPEEKAAREKREKREAVLSAVGDGISALSNLFFTTKGAPNSYDPRSSMSAAARARWDKLKAEREANLRIYNEGYLRALSMDLQDEKDERNWRHTIERERIADRRYEDKAKRDAALADLNEQLKRHQITAAEYKAEQERIASEYAEAYEQSRIGKNIAAATASVARAGAEDRRNAKEFSAWDENGKEHKFKSKSAAIEFAKQHGTYKQDMVTNSDVVTKITPGRVDSKGNKLSEDRKSEIIQTDTKKPGDGYASKPDAEAETEGDKPKKSAKSKFSIHN